MKSLLKKMFDLKRKQQYKNEFLKLTCPNC